MITEDLALFETAQPVNPRPFIHALGKHLEAGGNITDSKTRRILWVNLAIQYGQLAKIDLASLDRDAVAGEALEVVRGYESRVESDSRTQERRIMRLAVLAYGNTGTLDLTDEWNRLYEEHQQGKLPTRHVVADQKPPSTVVAKLHGDGDITIQPFAVKPEEETVSWNKPEEIAEEEEDDEPL